MTSPRAKHGAASTRREFLALAWAVATIPALVRCRGREHADGASTAASAPLATEPVLRVRLDDPPARGATLGRSGRWVRLSDGDTSANDLILPGPVVLERRADGWRAHDERGNTSRADGRRTLTLAEISAGEVLNHVVVEGVVFPGAIRAVPWDDAAFRLVNHVPMETYLPGVLASELYGHWNPETFAAQAIASRSYALSEIRRAAHRDWDVRASPRSQAYAGRTDHESSLDAARRTRGQVLTWSGELLPAYYSSCCGGTAARAIDAIGAHPINRVAPLQGRTGDDPCSESPRYRWRMIRATNALERQLHERGERRGPRELTRLGRLRRIVVSRVNIHGRPAMFTVEDMRGRLVELDAESFRRAVNAGVDGRSVPSLHSSDVRVVVDGNEVVFFGRGFGHGVGLCQFGAQALARAGEPHRRILEWYYPGATLEPAYA